MIQEDEIIYLALCLSKLNKLLSYYYKKMQFSILTKFACCSKNPSVASTFFFVRLC